MKTSRIFRDAWKLAKKGQKRFGGAASQYFRIALVLAWKASRGMSRAANLSGIAGKARVVSDKLKVNAGPVAKAIRIAGHTLAKAGVALAIVTRVTLSAVLACSPWLAHMSSGKVTRSPSPPPRRITKI